MENAQGQAGQMSQSLLPQDVAVALELALVPGEQYESLSRALHIGTGAAHRSVQRLERAGLLVPSERQVVRGALLEFLSHGLRYAFFAEPGSIALGVPTAHSAPPLADEFQSDEPYVWASPKGSVRGMTIEPLLKHAAKVSMENGGLYAALSLVDAIRVGQSRERIRATDLLRDLLVPDRPR
jgi:hypothetical protein